MNDLKYLKPLVKKKVIVKSDKIRAVTYTRISSSGQSNFSLELQEETISEYCKKYNVEIVREFGGIPESAKTDNRKEFNKLITFITQSQNTKNPINAIIVSQLDRFSRSDDNISLYNKVINMGIKVLQANSGQPPSNVEQGIVDKIHLLFANEDNQKRRKNCIGGMQKKLKKGELIGPTPMGYDYYGPLVSDRSMYSYEQRIEINEIGVKLKKAWKWKLQGHNDAVIMKRLKVLGVKVSKQNLSKMWRNTFYCGVRFSSMLDEPVIGKWEAMITAKEFAKVNGLLNHNRKTYEPSIMESHRPLQGYICCPECDRKFTGYRSKKTGTHYYKCGTKGCKGGNLNAKRTQNSTKDGAHEMFTELLNEYTLNPELKAVFKSLLQNLFIELNNEESKEQKWLKTQKTILETKIGKATNLYIEGKLKDEIYNKTITVLENEQNEIDEKLDNLNIKSSNLLSQVDNCVEITSNLSKIWDLASYEDKCLLQKTCVKSPLYYEKKNRQFRTSKVNTVLSKIRGLKDTKGGKNEKDSSENSDESLEVELQRIELWSREDKL